MNFKKSDLLAALIATLIYCAIGGWFLMLGVGVVHHQWIKECPTIGFYWACLLASLIRGALFTYDSKD